MKHLWLLLTCLLLAAHFSEISCRRTEKSASKDEANASQPKKSKDRCSWNHVWNGTACVPGCEGWRYLEDGVCTPIIRRIGAWFQFGLCILGVGATLFLTPPEHAFLKPVFLSLIGFALLLNSTTWILIGMLPNAAAWMLHAALESVVVTCWTMLDLFIYYLLLWVPADLMSIKDIDVRGLLTLIAKVIFAFGMIWGRGVDFAANLPHLVPVYFIASLLAPQIKAAFQDPHAPESVVTLRNSLAGLSIGQIYFVYALVVCLFALPMVRIVAHLLPNIVTLLVITAEVIALPFYASPMNAYYKVITQAPVQVPQGRPTQKDPTS